MALIAEEIVEEWLNRQGFFTIRGIRLGVHEMDILAIRQDSSGWDLRHYEVHASINAISYISSVPKLVQREELRKPGSAKLRNNQELEAGVREWIEKKFHLKKKADIRRKLCPGNWSIHLVVGEVRHKKELEILKRSGVEVTRLSKIIADLKAPSPLNFKAAGNDLCGLITMGAPCGLDSQSPTSLTGEQKDGRSRTYPFDPT